MHTGDNSPDSLKCPITYELFRDPVIGGDGHTYERENITAWIRKHSTSPITRQPMDLNSLRPNYIVKKLVEDFVSSSLQKQYQFRLDVDICKANNQPIFRSPDKTIYKANWMLKHGPPIILITIDGAKATREASFYVKLSCHPHIVRTYGLVDSNSSDSIMLVQEYAPEGDLRKLFRDNNFRPTIEVLLEIFWQIVDAMICLADNQIIHGDLACRNVLVFRSSSNQSTEILVKLTDFGLTRTSSLFSAIDSPALSTMKMIPIRYAAPEILVDTSPNSYSEKSDVYSFGVLMWEACSGGAVPYGDLKTTDNVYEEKLKGKILERPNSCPDELWNIILNCTQHESHERPNFKAVQEALLRLRFQNPRESFNRTSSITNLTDKTRRRSSNQEHIPKDSQYDRPKEFSFYQNLDNTSHQYMNSPSSNPNQSLSEYYIPCEYCLQSINTESFDTHDKVCPVRRLARSFAKIAARFPPLEITSCQYCEHLIPLNMLNIHQNTCNNNSINLQNAFRSSPQQPLEDSYATFTSRIYLKPMSLPKSQPDEDFDEYATLPNEQTQNRLSTYAAQSEISSHSSASDATTDGKGSKSSKSGFFKSFSKFKKKFSP